MSHHDNREISRKSRECQLRVSLSLLIRPVSFLFVAQASLRIYPTSRCAAPKPRYFPPVVQHIHLFLLRRDNHPSIHHPEKTTPSAVQTSNEKQHEIMHLHTHDPKFDANDAKLGPFIAQRLVAKRLAPGAVPDVEPVVQPEPVVSTAGPDAQEARLAVHAKVV